MADEPDANAFNLIHAVCKEANVDPSIVFAALLESLASTHVMSGFFTDRKQTAFDEIRSQMGLLKQIGLLKVDDPPTSVLEAVSLFVKSQLWLAKANKQPQAAYYAACGTILNRLINAGSRKGLQYSMNFDEAAKTDKDLQGITPLPTKDEAFETWCEQIKATDQPVAIFDSPDQLGDTYEEVMAKLHRLKAHKLAVYFPIPNDDAGEAGTESGD